ncbi:putative uncharacterized protein DDB_G0290521 [Maniola jurtina]|uniref:putative uncharacterized protein DDB_G0290521 n=1 Tax=Maniola jurtina TaxID=191418 RepID=UPI001E68E3D4|nr:putative uncharacterized protein DDB_G0290521 [Maniola jurtina]
MDYLISLLLVLPCVRAGVYPSGPSSFGLGGGLIDLRSHAYPVYASDSSGEEYEAFAVATLPQHPPVRIVQIFSPPHRQPALGRPRRPARRPRPQPDADAYSTHNERRYEPVEYEEVYASEEEARPKYSYSKSRDQFEDEDTVVMYARPNRSGGYTYRRAQSARVTTPLATPAPSPAVVLMPAAAPSPTAVLVPEPSPSPTPTPTPTPRARQSEPVIIRIHKYRVIH